MFVIIYLAGVILALAIMPLWIYFYERRLAKKIILVDIVFIPIVALLSWFWLYCMWCIFNHEDKFEIKTLGMPTGKLEGGKNGYNKKQ